MRLFYTIAMDIHSYNCHVLVTTPSGRKRCEVSLPTELNAIIPVIEGVPRPRHVVMEAGPLAGWLYRNLQSVADEVVVAETRRNAFIAKEGDKSDAIDAMKLAQLYRGGFVRAVHHATDEARASFKELVMYYHRRVSMRVSAGLRVIWAFREHGVVLTEKVFRKASDRGVLFEMFKGHGVMSLRLRSLFEDYDLMLEHESVVRCELERLSKGEQMIGLLRGVPGVGVIWASTFYALVDTPYRFKRKSKLWRYMGIGLQLRSSGKGYESVGLGTSYNRCLKNMILSAAQCAVRCDENIFSDQYRSLLARGVFKRAALRTVGRSMAAVMWGMFKSQTAYRPDWVGALSGEC